MRSGQSRRSWGLLSVTGEANSQHVAQLSPVTGGAGAAKRAQGFVLGEESVEFEVLAAQLNAQNAPARRARPR